MDNETNRIKNKKVLCWAPSKCNTNFAPILICHGYFLLFNGFFRSHKVLNDILGMPLRTLCKQNPTKSIY